jgi:hypothetical protein
MLIRPADYGLQNDRYRYREVEKQYEKHCTGGGNPEH